MAPAYTNASPLGMALCIPLWYPNIHQFGIPGGVGMGQTLYAKVFDRHVVREVTPGQFQLLASLHLLNEVSSPPAFEALRERRLDVRHKSLTFGSSDHSISTSGRHDDYADPMAAEQVRTMGRNTAEFGVSYFDPALGEHGITHVVAPERGLTQPGSVI